MASISIIIPCFNARSWIRQALQSVLAQDLRDIEVIVIDDGSTDDSAGVVEKEFPLARLIRTENLGPSKARNLGTQHSKGEFIQYLDADDMLAPGKLAFQLDALKESGADIAYGPWQRLEKNINGVFEKKEIIKKILRKAEIDLFTDFWCPPATYLFRRAIIEKAGGWNEKLPVIQDARLALDCALQGGSFVYCPGVMCYYRVHKADSVSTRDPLALVRDCFKNAYEIEEWWQKHGGIGQERKRALLRVYGDVARASFKKDKTIFEDAYKTLERLNPGYIPQYPKRLKLISQLFGYRKAEAIASWYRHGRSLFNIFHGGGPI